MSGVRTGAKREGFRVAIVGGGPAGLMAADVLSAAGAAVHVFDRMPSVGRKFLMAGRGGLNLTHSEDFEAFVARYGDRAPILRPILEAFPPLALMAWAEGLGQPVFTGSSGRVFPKAMKASPLLRALLARLIGRGVTFHLRHDWRGWNDSGVLAFAKPDGGTTGFGAHATILALGGASWPRLGARGEWMTVLADEGVEIAPFRPANCGFTVAWSPHLRERFAGAPLKSARFRFAGRDIRGEATIARYGIEGGAIYALSAPLRDSIAAHGSATLELDLRPDIPETTLRTRLAKPRGKASRANHLRKSVGLSPLEIALLHEDKTLASDAASLAQRIKALPLVLTEPQSLDRAISTAGGVRFSSLDSNLMLKAKPGVYVAGEMLDWEAPTGGYLLQACFATGVWAARSLSPDRGRGPG